MGCATEVAQYEYEGVLPCFTDWWRTRNGSGPINDLVQLFAGKQVDPGTTIGCAWTKASCGGWALGVNEINYTNAYHGQKNLVTHEMGHILGK